MLNRRVRKLMRIFLPLLFIAYIGCNICFIHTHEVAGVIIAHSHPGAAGHTHNGESLGTIFCLTHFFVLDEVVPEFSLFSQNTRFVLLEAPTYVEHHLLVAGRIHGLRAPPAVAA